MLPIGVANDIKRLQPHLESAEVAFIKPLLGVSLYEELGEFYEERPEGELTRVQEDTSRLLAMVQSSIVHLAYFMGFDVLNVSISDMGFMRAESNTSKSLFKYQEDNLREYFKNNGFNSLDDILLFIESNIDSFNEFAASPNYTVIKGAFIPNTAAFHEIFFIHNSRLTFLRLKPHMRFIEETVIRPVLTPEIYQVVKQGMVLPQVPDQVAPLIPYIRPVMAYLSAALLMEESGADMSERGLFFHATMPNNRDNRQITASDHERVMMLVNRARQMGNLYLEALKSYLSDNWTGYSGRPRPLSRDNNGKKTFWA